MTGLIDSAKSILVSSERRVEISASNVANASTSGFKRGIGFSEVIQQQQGAVGHDSEPQLVQANDFAQGQMVLSGNALDLAISGPGFVALRSGDDTYFSRGAEFSRTESGALADAAGRIVQQADGADLVVGGGELEILPDGTVLEDGLPVGAIGLFEMSDPHAVRALGGSLFAIEESSVVPAETTQVLQGYREQSNVVMSDEMVAMMAAIRQAEGGGRLVQFYDQLMGQAIQTFSRSGR